MGRRNLSEGRLPNLIVIGAMKSGTSSLHYYLDEHPDIQMSKRKELHFFIEERNWNKGIDWYRSQFQEGAAVAGESTPAYTNYPERLGIPERMSGVIPKAKLIYIVRDPIERAVSNYVHQVTAGRETRPISEAIWDESMAYIPRSKYYMQLSRYLPFFPLEQIIVINTSDLRNAPIQTLQTVFDFIAVDNNKVRSSVTQERGRTSAKRRPTPFGLKLSSAIDSLHFSPHGNVKYLKYGLMLPFSKPMEKPVLDEKVHDRLRETFDEDVTLLRALTGAGFADWSV